MKKLYGFILVLSLCFFCTSNSQGVPYWAKTYGGSGAESSSFIQETTDGGCVIVGHTESSGAGNSDAWIVKLDTNGSTAWQNTYGGSDADEANAIQQTTDGGYIVAGITLSFGAGGWDAWIIKLDSDGNVTWQKTYGGIDVDKIYSIQETTEGGYVIAGSTASFGIGEVDVWIIKLDSDGNITWQKTYGGSNEDEANAIQQTTDGGYVVAGLTNFGAGAGDAWIIKLDSDGNVTWQKTYEGSSVDAANAIQQTTDGGYVVAGVNFAVGAGDAWIIKLDSNGSITWQKTYGGGDVDGAYAIQQTTIGGYVVAGLTLSFGAGGWDAWILKLDTNGNITWQKTYGGNNDDRAFSIQETTNGGYIVTGYSGSFGSGNDDGWILKLDSNGTIPYCDIMETSNATITDTTVSGQDTNATIINTTVTPDNTTVTPVDSSDVITTICEYDPLDFDNDGILNNEDNCPNVYNPEQADTSPPEGNGIGDDCDCEGNFNCDDDCDGTDASTFKLDFGRLQFSDPCESGNLCNGDFNCDGDVDGTDAALFKQDFGRLSFDNPCPACEVGDWCVYPEELTSPEDNTPPKAPTGLTIIQ